LAGPVPGTKTALVSGEGNKKFDECGKKKSILLSTLSLSPVPNRLNS